jgi:hypothetical protein
MLSAAFVVLVPATVLMSLAMGAGAVWIGP